MKTISDYLDSDVSHMLEAVPFKNWPVEKFVEEDLEEKLTSYTFKEHGFEVSCDPNDKISVIFLYSQKYNGFDESLFEIPFSWDRKQVLEHFGAPSKSGAKVSDPILGDYGPWDCFTRPGYAIHIGYQTDSAKIKQITLMRNDVVP